MADGSLDPSETPTREVSVRDAFGIDSDMTVMGFEHGSDRVPAADTTYRADRAPRMGETILGNSFTLGPGGKGSNQSVTAALANNNIHFISRLNNNTFTRLAHQT